MLTSDELLDAYHGDDQHRHIHMDGAHGEGLRAVEAAVRADLMATVHAECDCVPELGPSHCHPCSDEGGGPATWPCPVVADPIRADQIARDADLADRVDDDACYPGDIGRAIRAQLTTKESTDD